MRGGGPKEYRQGPGRQIAAANLKSTPVTKILLIAIGIGYLWELVVAGGPGSLFNGPGFLDLIDAGALVPAGSLLRGSTSPSAWSAANGGAWSARCSCTRD